MQSYVYQANLQPFYSLKLTDEQNLATYGPCNNPNGHGHNYKGDDSDCAKLHHTFVSNLILNNLELLIGIDWTIQILTLPTVLSAFHCTFGECFFKFFKCKIFNFLLVPLIIY